MAERADVLTRHGELREKRALEEAAWRNIAFFLRPDDTSFEPAQPTTRRDDAEIFDSSPLYANEEFAGGIFSQMSNPANRWFELATAPDQDLNRTRPVRQWTWQTANVMYASLRPAASQFYAQAPATFADMGAFGFGVIAQEEMIGQWQIADRSIPISQAYIDVDAAGNVDTFHNAFLWNGRQCKQFFKEKTPAECRDNQTYLIIHAVYPNPDYRDDKQGSAYMRLASCYVSPDLAGLKVEGGYRQLPYHVIGWSRRAGRAYPRGPGHTARADMYTLNEIERSDLIATHFAAEPPLLFADEDAVSAADIAPNAQLAGMLSERGQALVQYLERRSQLQPILQKANQKRAAIQMAFKFSLSQLLERPQMTLGEFQGWQQEALRSMAPNLIQVQMGLAGFLARRYAILNQMKRIPPAPPELEGQLLSIEFVSPLDKLQQMEQGRSVLTVHEGIEKFALTDPSVRDLFDADTGARVLAGSLYSVPGLLRDEKTVAELRKARAGAVQQQQALDQAGQVAEVAATASHAAQAATAAGQRTGR